MKDTLNHCNQTLTTFSKDLSLRNISANKSWLVYSWIHTSPFLFNPEDKSNKPVFNIISPRLQKQASVRRAWQCSFGSQAPNSSNTHGGGWHQGGIIIVQSTSCGKDWLPKALRVHAAGMWLKRKYNTCCWNSRRKALCTGWMVRNKARPPIKLVRVHLHI